MSRSSTTKSTCGAYHLRHGYSCACPRYMALGDIELILPSICSSLILHYGFCTANIFPYILIYTRVAYVLLPLDKLCLVQSHQNQYGLIIHLDSSKGLLVLSFHG